MDELDCHRRAHDGLGLDAVTGEEDEQWAQALPAGGDRRAGVVGQRASVVAGELGQAPLDPVEQVWDVPTARAHDLGDLDGCHAFVPT
jgi:hypothetical protein